MGLKTLQNGLYSLFWPILLDIFISRNGSSYCFLPLKQIFIMLICFMPDLLLLCFLTYITFPYSLQCTLAAGQAYMEEGKGRAKAKALWYLSLLTGVYQAMATVLIIMLLCSSHFCWSASSEDDKYLLLLLIFGFPFNSFCNIKQYLY